MAIEIHELIRFPATEKLFRARATALDPESRFRLHFTTPVRVDSVRVGQMIVACSDAYADLVERAERSGVDVLTKPVTDYECRVIVRRGEIVIVTTHDPKVRTTVTFDWTPVARGGERA